MNEVPAHDVAWSIHLPCGRCGSTSETGDCVPTVNSTWTRNRDGATLTVTGITTIHGKPNVQYETSHPDRTDRGVGISELDYFLAHNTEVAR